MDNSNNSITISSLDYHRKAFSVLFKIYIDDNFSEECNAEFLEYYSHDDQ